MLKYVKLAYPQGLFTSLHTFPPATAGITGELQSFISSLEWMYGSVIISLLLYRLHGWKNVKKIFFSEARFFFFFSK